MPETNDCHENHAANRLEMAIRIGDWLRENYREQSKAEDVATMGAGGWKLVTRLMGEKRVPSTPTQASVVRYLEICERKELELDLWISCKIAEAIREAEGVTLTKD